MKGIERNLNLLTFHSVLAVVLPSFLFPSPWLRFGSLSLPSESSSGIGSARYRLRVGDMGARGSCLLSPRFRRSFHLRYTKYVVPCGRAASRHRVHCALTAENLKSHHGQDQQHVQKSAHDRWDEDRSKLLQQFLKLFPRSKNTRIRSQLNTPPSSASGRRQ